MGGTTCSANADCSADSFCTGEGRCVSDVVSVAAGYSHTCAVRKDGKVFCWGGNDTAQVGMAAGGNVLRPVEVPINEPIRKLALGGGFSCAITTDDRVVCWGDNQVGQLGDGTVGGNRAEPAFVKMHDGSDLHSVGDLGAGSCFSCALTSSSGVSVYCWGCNNRSQLGLNTAESAQSAVPVPVPSAATAQQLAVGYEEAHFLGSDTICGWGSNAGAALSGATTTTFAVPTCFALAPVQQTFLGEGYGCARLVSGGVQCWGLQIGSSTILAPPGTIVPGIVATTLGGGMGHVCVRDANANVRCWGANFYGSLGDGTSQDSTIPTTVLDAQGAALAGVLSGGLTSSGVALHGCAILGDGSLYCWGWNLMGQIGNGASNNNEPNATPVKW
jgi:alpha-tubulin suppressor-like RCC1 family protein